MVIDKDVGGGTVYIDASALGELSSQLTPQDLETLVSFNIPVHAADLDVLQDHSDGQVSTYYTEACWAK